MAASINSADLHSVIPVSKGLVVILEKPFINYRRISHSLPSASFVAIIYAL